MSANESIKILTRSGSRAYVIDTGEKRFAVLGLADRDAADMAEFAADADAVICLTSRPDRIGGLSRMLDVMPELEVYATTAGLRNIKAILNRDINERLIKDGMEECGITFVVTPCLPWVDTAMVIFDNVLFSGDAFSGFDGTAVGLKNYFDDVLAVNKGFAKTAAERFVGTGIERIYPAYGAACLEGSVCLGALPDEVFGEYIQWCEPEPRKRKKATVICHSRYGFTAALAQRAAGALSDEFDTVLVDAAKEPERAAFAANDSDVLAVGTNTENRGIPQGIWRALSGLDAINKRQMPYFVFGSFGWAADAIKLCDTILSGMGLRRAAKPVEVLFRPTEDDFKKIDAAAKRLIECEHSRSENSRVGK